ncbi:MULTISPECIES: thioredoxin family protein [Luteimonas]|uniref:thioredoxin family protein n=1 Tax=Luteimonas TaxID=83614 RepID=UPI000C7E6DC8|nr:MULTISPECIES: thioredoxin family protein [Luteimonas]
MPGLVALEFGTDWCGHCQAAQTPLAATLGARGDITHLKIEDGKGRPLGRSFRVTLWPTVILLRDGEEVARIVRPTSAGDIAPALALF